MTSILSTLLSYVLLYKYTAIALVVYLGAVGVPFPANAMLLAVGAFASQGYVNFWAALAVAILTNTLGDLTDYGLAHHYGDGIIHRLRMDKVTFFTHLKEELRTDAAITVFITRFAGSLSSVANFLAGLVKVPLPTFIIFDLLGNIIEPGAALTIGYLVGDYWNNFSNLMGLGTGIVAVGSILFVLFRMHRRMMRKYSS